MRLKKQSVIISGGIAVFSFFIFTVISLFDHPETTLIKYIGTITSGLFTSSIVTLLIFIKEYHSEKRRTIEYFYDVNNQLIKHFNILQYFEIDTLDNEKKLDEVKLQYMKLNEEIDLHDVIMSYHDIELFCGNDKYRDELMYENIYKRQHEALKRIRSLNQEYSQNKIIDDKRKNKDYSSELKLINDIQEFIFTSEQNGDFISVYNQYAYDINCNLYELLKWLYGKNYKDEKPSKKEFWCGSFYYSNK